MTEKNAARGNILWFRLVGKLTEEDYTDNLIPELERALEQYKKIRLLIQVEYSGGWTQGGAWEELKGWPQFSKVERMAIVADDSWDEWMTWMVKITGIFTGLSVRFFKAGRFHQFRCGEGTSKGNTEVCGLGISKNRRRSQELLFE